MSVCPGCGRCRECGQRTAPTFWHGSYPHPVFSHGWIQFGAPAPQSPYYIGDPMPGQEGSITITSSMGGAI